MVMWLGMMLIMMFMFCVCKCWCNWCSLVLLFSLGLMWVVFIILQLWVELGCVIRMGERQKWLMFRWWQQFIVVVVCLKWKLWCSCSCVVVCGMLLCVVWFGDMEGVGIKFFWQCCCVCGVGVLVWFWWCRWKIVVVCFLVNGDVSWGGVWLCWVDWVVGLG